MQFFGGSEISPSPPAPTASGNNGHMLYVFNRNGICLLYREWNRPLHTLNAQQDHKLMFGLLFSLKSLTAKMDPTSAEKGNLGVPQLPGQGCSFHSFRTNTYKLSFMETPSGIKLRGWVSRTAEKAMMAVGNLREVTKGLGIAENKLFSSFSNPVSPPSPLFRAYPSIHRHHSCMLSTLYEEKM
ncbi:trafficking protein particle complex subunit 1-like protein [Trifolium pratense]|uniref:Trafficking protein particle complex subunit n=2 Tax=Trifolium TaxID=3898 RepID=A0A2K3PAP4_TRIPR|nr:trafficking protein particle complex subunit 1-like protein [Trifolium pratense]